MGWIKSATVVEGTSPTGVYAADGSFNVVEAVGDVPCGVQHPCGAYWVTATAEEYHSVYAPDGSLYIDEDLLA